MEDYSELVSDIEAAVTETVEESGVSTDGYEAVKAAAMKQARCLSNVRLIHIILTFSVL